MEICLICGKEFVDRENGYEGDMCELCTSCSRKKITNKYNCTADREERELIQRLIRVDDILS